MQVHVSYYFVAVLLVMIRFMSLLVNNMLKSFRFQAKCLSIYEYEKWSIVPFWLNLFGETSDFRLPFDWKAVLWSRRTISSLLSHIYPVCHRSSFLILYVVALRTDINRLNTVKIRRHVCFETLQMSCFLPPRISGHTSTIKTKNNFRVVGRRQIISMVDCLLGCLWQTSHKRRVDFCPVSSVSKCKSCTIVPACIAGFVVGLLMYTLPSWFFVKWRKVPKRRSCWR